MDSTDEDEDSQQEGQRDQWDLAPTVTRICEFFDQDSGPQLLSVYDYHDALETLSLGPNQEIYDALAQLSETKSYLGCTWLEAMDNQLVDLAAYVQQLEAIRTLQKHQTLAELRRYNTRISQSLAFSYSFQTQEYIVPAWELWKRRVNDLPRAHKMYKQQLVAGIAARFKCSLLSIKACAFKVQMFRTRRVLEHWRNAAKLAQIQMRQREKTVSSVLEVMLTTAKRAPSVPAVNLVAGLAMQWRDYAERLQNVEAETPPKQLAKRVLAVNAVQVQRKLAAFETKSRHALLTVWFCTMKRNLLKASWLWRLLVTVLDFWKLQCFAHVHRYYLHLNQKQRVLGNWLGRMYQHREDIVYARCSISSVDLKQRALAALRQTAQAIHRDEAVAQHARRLNTMRQFLTTIYELVDRFGDREAMAATHFCHTTTSAVCAQWYDTYRHRRNKALEARASALRQEHAICLITIYYSEFKLRATTLASLDITQKRQRQQQALQHWKQLVHKNAGTLAQLQSQIASRLVEKTVARVVDAASNFEIKIDYLRRINTYQLEVAAWQQMRSQAVRITARNHEIQGLIRTRRRQLLRRVVNHCVAQTTPQDPITPRSARRLPPSIRRKIENEVHSMRPSSASTASSRSSSAGSMAPATPTRTNRILWNLK